MQSVSNARSDTWPKTWAAVLRTFNNILDETERDIAEIDSDLSEPGKRKRFASLASGTRWAHFYESSLALHLVRIFPTLFPLKLIAALARPGALAALGRALHDKRQDQLPDLPHEPEKLPALLAAGHSVKAQMTAYIVFGETMSNLVARGRGGDDNGYLKAIRIDPAALAGQSLGARIQLAVATHDKAFLTGVASALRNPIRIAARDNPRLQGVLLLMAKTKQLDRLTPNLAVELFIKRTRLYRASGDAERSLWRFITRWKKRHATRISKEKSS